jgi:hypothetical protein
MYSVIKNWILEATAPCSTSLQTDYDYVVLCQKRGQPHYITLDLLILDIEYIVEGLSSDYSLTTRLERNSSAHKRAATSRTLFRVEDISSLPDRHCPRLQQYIKKLKTPCVGETSYLAGLLRASEQPWWNAWILLGKFGGGKALPAIFT